MPLQHIVAYIYARAYIYINVLNTIKKFYTKVYLCISKMPKTL